MTVAERVKTCRLLEKMEKNKEYCKKIGLEDISKYQSNKKETSK